MKTLLPAIILLITASCSQEKQPETPIEIPQQDSMVVQKDTVVLEEPEPIIDSAFYALAKHIPSTFKFYRFECDTFYHSAEDSITLFKYDIDSVVAHYSLMIPYSKQNGDSTITTFCNSLKTAEYCIGISGIDAWMFSTEHSAQKAQELFDKTGDKSYHHVFEKTLSFGVTHNKTFYVFHSRRMGESWYLKRYYKWFEEYLKEEK